MPKSGNNTRPYTRSQKTLKGKDVDDKKTSAPYTAGQRAQAEREGRARASKDVAANLRKIEDDKKTRAARAKDEKRRQLNKGGKK